VGHAFGPDSWEVMDATLKTDKAVARLLEELDNKVGEGRWTLFLTADHGIASFPELLVERRLDAGRINGEKLEAELEEALEKQFGATEAEGGYIASLFWPWINLQLPEAKVGDEALRLQMARAVAGYLRADDRFALAEATADLLAQPREMDPLRRSILLAYYPDRAGDVAFAAKPGYQLGSRPTGVNHGAPWRYDQHVALLAYGAGIEEGITDEPVSPPQIAPTISALLGIMPPDQCEVPVLPNALKD